MNLKQHPLSSAWPGMQDDEYQAIKDSISNIGVQNPITIFEGMVIDGWHRYRAATELGMHCPSKLLGDVDPIDFVKSQNDARRHITASQKALAITAIYAWKPAHREIKGTPGVPLSKSNAELAEIAGVHENTIKQAKAVQAKATPEVKAAVKAGTMSVKKAAETVKPKKDKPPKTEKPKVEPTPLPETAKVPAEDEDYTDLDAVNDQIQDLQAELVVLRMSSKDTDEQHQAAELIAELRKQLKAYEINLKAVTRSRDQLQNENAELRKQITRQRKEIDRATGRKTA